MIGLLIRAGERAVMAFMIAISCGVIMTGAARQRRCKHPSYRRVGGEHICNRCHKALDK